MLTIWICQREAIKYFKRKGKGSQLNKNKNHMLRLNSKNRSSVCEIMKEKGAWASSSVTAQTAKAAATACGEHSVKTEKALHLYSKIFWERETVFTLYYRKCCYNCSILLLGVVNILVYLTYKFNFILGMYVSEKHNKGFGMIHAFRHLLGVLEYIPVNKGDYCNLWSLGDEGLYLSCFVSVAHCKIPVISRLSIIFLEG